MSDILDGIGEHEPLDLEPIKADHARGYYDADDGEKLIAEVEHLRAAAELDAETRNTPTECGSCGHDLKCPNCARPVAGTYADKSGTYAERGDAALRALAETWRTNADEGFHSATLSLDEIETLRNCADALTAEVEALKP